MEEEKSIFISCSQSFGDDDYHREGVSIIFIQPKNIDLTPFALYQAAGSLSGLKFGDHQLPPASSVLFVEGQKITAELQKDIKSCECDFDQGKLQLLSMKTYKSTIKASSTNPDIPVTDSVIVDQVVEHAKAEKQLCVIFHDLQSLTAGGTLCKPADFRDLHNRLKAAGAIQLYFVHTEAEATQIAVKPDLVFNISKVSDTFLPTIRLNVISSSARIQDTILPLELELEYGQDGSWKVEASANYQTQEEAIKSLALMGKTHKQIAEILGNTSASTVGRRLKKMEKQGLIIIKGHRVSRA